LRMAPRTRPSMPCHGLGLRSNVLVDGLQVGLGHHRFQSSRAPSGLIGDEGAAEHYGLFTGMRILLAGSAGLPISGLNGPPGGSHAHTPPGEAELASFLRLLESLGMENETSGLSSGGWTYNRGGPGAKTEILAQNRRAWLVGGASPGCGRRLLRIKTRWIQASIVTAGLVVGVEFS